MASIEVFDKKYENPITYYMDDRLRWNLLEKVKPSLEKRDKDYIIAIDGNEGAGKSWFAFQIGKFIDPTLDISRVTFTPEEFREAIFKAEKGQCVIYDEAFTGLSSRASLSGVNRVLVSLMMQMRQKNLFVIIVLPTFFLLDKYVALFRAKTLIHVYENKGTRGYFMVYSRKLKRMLFMTGQKTYSYSVKSRIKGRFYGVFALGDNKEEEKYKKKKAKALESVEKNPMSAGQVKYKEQRDIFLYLLRKELKLSYKEMENLLNEYDIEMSYVQIRNICAKFGDKDRDEDQNALIPAEK